MALSLPGWEKDDHGAVGRFLTEGVLAVLDGGADFHFATPATLQIDLTRERLAARRAYLCAVERR